jgi:dipeptidyl aminopeptidase/acylaminoacyl peptidase
MFTRRLAGVVAGFSLLSTLLIGQAAKHALTLDDISHFREVRDPQLSPDGQWVAYAVSTVDLKEDKAGTDIWTASYDGKIQRQMTSSADSESSPRWSPDGHYLSFTSSRPGPAKGDQVWLLDRGGGEAIQLTDVKGKLQGSEWSPDSRRLALVIGDPEPDAPPAGSGEEVPAAAAENKPKAPKPIVIDRYKYKQDGQGYLLSDRHSYVYLFDIATKKLDRLTQNRKWDESSPSWSPDGSRIAFTSNHVDDPDREPSNQIYVAEPSAGAVEKAITPMSVRAGRGKPEWSPDGKMIAFLDSDDKKWGAYNMEHASVVPSDGSAAPTRVTAIEALDRGVSTLRFTSDGKALTFVVTDDESAYPARVSLGGGPVQRLLQPPVVVSSWMTAANHSVVISGGDGKYNEVYAFNDGILTQMSHQNDALMSQLELGQTEPVSFKSKDGTEVHGLLTKPVGYVAGIKVPFLLRIHGGPNGQDGHSFSTERQWFAAHGYAVLAVNYRGSSGRGQQFSRAIYADWGHYEVEDLLAGVDHVIKMGVADPDRLGVGGWSYGGILTDYLIATDTRFKAATSGAGTAFTVSFYGTDQYIIQYDYEIGPPWDEKSWETYQKISYPFLHANRIHTPTLFLGGERDFNVPVQGGQQMYQALRSLGIDTQLIIYPNETHSISRPSYVRDRYERYVAWYDKFLKKAPATNNAAAGGGGE